MKESVVADTSCLIGLERIGRLDLLPALFEAVFVPPAVVAEFGPGPAWLRVETPTNRPLITVLQTLVDPGEAEAIALGVERGRRVLLDDRQARNVAERLGVPMLGVVGVLLMNGETSGRDPSRSSRVRSVGGERLLPLCGFARGSIRLGGRGFRRPTRVVSSEGLAAS